MDTQEGYSGMTVNELRAYLEQVVAVESRQFLSVSKRLFGISMTVFRRWRGVFGLFCGLKNCQRKHLLDFTPAADFL